MGFIFPHDTLRVSELVQYLMISRAGGWGPSSILHLLLLQYSHFQIANGFTDFSCYTVVTSLKQKLTGTQCRIFICPASSP